MPPLAIAVGIAGLAGAGAGIYGATAAQSAADEQVQAQRQALAFQQQVYNDQQQRIAPFVGAGQTSIAQLMAALSNGTFGPGSIPTFTAPTAAEAEATPGYEFTREQGNKGILEASAAAGGSISGGTLKAIDQFNTGLAESTYNDTFTRSLQTYQQQLATQAQLYQQLLTPAALGESAISSLNNTGSQTALNVGNLMAGIGNAQAAGTVGSANALSGGIGSLGSSALTAILLSKLFPNLASGSGSSTGLPFPQYGTSPAVPISPGEVAPPIMFGQGPS